MSNLLFIKTTLSELRFDDIAVLITPIMIWVAYFLNDSMQGMNIREAFHFNFSCYFYLCVEV